MRAMVMRLQERCNAARLELRQGRFLGSARISQRKDDHRWQVDYDLQIAKGSVNRDCQPETQLPTITTSLQASLD